MKKQQKGSNVLIENFDAIFDAIHDDILISDGEGMVLRVSPTFEDMYGVDQEHVVGKSVYELEKAGIFKPSVIARVLEKREKITMQQQNSKERKFVVTATPVFDE